MQDSSVVGLIRQIEEAMQRGSEELGEAMVISRR